MEKISLMLLGALGTIGAIACFAIVATIPVTLLWNWLMPALFGLVRITIWQAAGLIVLIGMLFRKK